jgi:hypothetical protein
MLASHWLGFVPVAIVFVASANAQEMDVRLLLAQGRLDQAHQIVAKQLEQPQIDTQVRCDQLFVGTALLTANSAHPDGYTWTLQGLDSLSTCADQSARVPLLIANGLKALEYHADDLDELQQCFDAAMRTLMQFDTFNDRVQNDYYRDALRVAAISLVRSDRFEQAQLLLQSQWNKCLTLEDSETALFRKSAVATTALETIGLLKREFVDSLVDHVSEALLSEDPGEQSLNSILNFERLVLVELAKSQPARCETRVQQLTQSLLRFESFDTNQQWQRLAGQVARLSQTAHKSSQSIDSMQILGELRMIAQREATKESESDRQPAKPDLLDQGRPHVVLLWSAGRRADLLAFQQFSRWAESGKWMKAGFSAFAYASRHEWSDELQRPVRSKAPLAEMPGKEHQMILSIIDRYTIAVPCGLIENGLTALPQLPSPTYLLFAANGELLARLPAEPQSLPMISSLLVEHP